MRASRLWFGTIVVALVGAACSAAVSGGPGTMVPGDQPGTRLPRPGNGGSGSVVSATMRYVCRGQVQTGWIAIDYIDDTEGCSTSRQRYGVAAIVPLANTAVGGILEVCAEERIPANWHQTRIIAGDSRCPPSKPVAETDKPTVREIRRDR